MRSFLKSATAVVIVLFFCSGCYNTQKLVRYQSTSPSVFEVAKLNGDYINTSATRPADTYYNLWSLLYDCKSFKPLHKYSERSIVRLSFDGRSRLTVSLLLDSVIVKTIDLRGHLKDNYLSIKRHLLIVPFPFAFYYGETKVILSMDESGALVLTNGTTSLMWLLIMAGGKDGVRTNKYQKVSAK